MSSQQGYRHLADLLVTSSYAAAIVFAALALYLTWDTGHPAVLVMFGGKAILAALVANGLRQKTTGAGG